MSFDAIIGSSDFQSFLATNNLEIPTKFVFKNNSGRIKDTDNNTLSVLLTYHDEITAREGKPFVRVHWFNGKGSLYFVPKGKNKELTAKEKREYAIKKQEKEQRNKELRLQSMQRAYHEYKTATAPCKNHQYLTDKGVLAHYGIRFATQTLTETDSFGEKVYRLCKGEMIIPIISLDKKFMSYQRIRSNGKKLLCTNGVKSGGFYPLGRWNATVQQVVLVEGYATGATLHEATGVTVFVCFDVGNVVTIAQMLKEQYPDLDVIIATDFDLEKGQAGLLTALQINQQLGYKVVFPINVVEGSDWNDLQKQTDQDFVHNLFFSQLADIEARSANEAAQDFYSFLNEKNLEKLAA